MENTVFERNYEIAEKDGRARAVFERAFAPGGFMEEFTKKMDAIPKVIVPEDKENYEYLLKLCDDYAKRHHGRIRGVVDYEHWDAHIDLYLKMLEFDDAEDMAFVKDIGEKAHYLCITPEKDGGYRFHIMINYFQELMSEEHEAYLKYETLMEDEELASMFDIPELSPEDEAIALLIKEILDRFDNETKVDRTTAFKAAISYLMRQGDEKALSVEKLCATLTALLEKVLDEEKKTEEQDS
ncbi:hypothetical protein [Dysosmobacter sp. HCP28S3_G4]|jgi:hypothetical protein|uniref:hypothetical protein n=1 Tax=Dysosmobacter sp. HCP28S3_G4 TaxID=3438938 RepID=UPI003F8B71DD